MNIQYLNHLPGNYSLTSKRPDLTELKESRFRRVYESALLFYPKDEVDQAANYRRSSTNDQAVISDFESFEQPEHPIPKDEHYYRAVSYSADLFRPARTLHPVAFPDLRYYPWNLRPSAEAPWNLEDYRFTPNFRNVDNESETPKLKEHIEKLSYWISDSKIKVKDYLRIKQTLGITKDDNPSFHNLYNEIFILNRSLVHFIKDGLHPFWDGITPRSYYWNTLHARAHVVNKDEPDKIRAVFGAPKLLLMVENMFVWPIQASYLNNEAIGPLLWGRETIRGGWRKLYSEAQQGGTPSSFLSLDWSQFDKRLLFDLIDEVHGIWRTFFDFTLYEPTSFYPHAKPNPVRIERLWKWMCHSIKHNPILLPNGRLAKWTWSGFGSGYQQTQLMDSHVNVIMITTCLSSLGVNVLAKSFWIRVQGDDSLIAFYEQMYVIYGPSFLTMLADSAMYYFNAKLSDKKSQFSNKLNGMSVLSFHNSYGLPYRMDVDLLTHLMFPETPGTQEQLLAAAYGLGLSSCGCSPRFHNLVSYLIKKLENKDIKPDPKSLHWMVRTNIFTTEEIQQLVTKPLPSRLELRANAWTHTPRTKAQKERLWPTQPGARERFYFLLPV